MGIKKVKFNSAGFRAVLQSKGAIAWTHAHGQRIAAAAGDGFEVRTSVGASRARTVVIAATPDAIKAEAEDKVLTSAIGGG